MDDAVDPENSIGYSPERTDLVGSQPRTNKDEDKIQFPQQKRDTGQGAKLLLREGSVSMSDSVIGILRPKTRNSEEDDTSSKSCRLSNNSSLADSDFGSSSDSVCLGDDSPALEEPPPDINESSTPERQGPPMVEDPQSMSDSESAYDSDSTLVGSEPMTPSYSSPPIEELPPSTPERQPSFQNAPPMAEESQSMSDSDSSESMPSFYSSSTTPNDVDQQLQTTPSSPSGVPTPSSVAPLPGPRISQTQINEAMTRIDTCLAQHMDRLSVIDNDNVGKFVQQSIQKTDDQLEAPYPFLPKGCIPDFNMDCVQSCQLMASKEFGNREQLYYQQMVAQPLPEEEGVIERDLSHRNSVKQV